MCKQVNFSFKCFLSSVEKINWLPAGDYEQIIMNGLNWCFHKAPVETFFGSCIYYEKWQHKSTEFLGMKIKVVNF